MNKNVFENSCNKKLSESPIKLLQNGKFGAGRVISLNPRHQKLQILRKSIVNSAWAEGIKNIIRLGNSMVLQKTSFSLKASISSSAVCICSLRNICDSSPSCFSGKAVVKAQRRKIDYCGRVLLIANLIALETFESGEGDTSFNSNDAQTN